MVLSMLLGFLLGLVLSWWLLPRRVQARRPPHEWAAYGQDRSRLPRARPGPPAHDGCAAPGAFVARDPTPGRIYLHSPP